MAQPKCSKCGAVGREHKKFQCPPRPGKKSAKRRAFRPIEDGAIPTAAIATEVPERGAPVPGVGGAKAGSHRRKRAIAA